MRNRSLRVIGLGVALASIGLTVATSALALPTHAFWNIYYSDAAHTEIVGEQAYSCTSFTRLEGVRTPYMVHIEMDHCSTWVGGTDPCDIMEYFC